ncbi:MAG: alpha/beta hydrolase [Dehalococcoidales bacterium]|jgi:pimeloyl-ACP methyl ester carboxylesterase
MNDNNAPDYSAIKSLPLEVNGRRVLYRQAGKGPPVVLIHGGASDSRDWLDTMQALAGRFTFYAPDLPGFGQSARDEKGYYLSDFTDFLAGFFDELKIQNPVLVGHSFGARVCLDMARLYPDRIGRLVLIDASGLGKMSLFGSVLFTFFWALRKALGRPQPFPRFLSKEGDDYNRVSDEVLKSIKVPTLLMWKGFDPYMPLKCARRAQKLIPGARLEIVPGYGHAPHQQKNHEEFLRIFTEFLDGNKAGET